MGMDEERKGRLEKMVATTQLTLPLIKGVFNVGVVLSLKGGVPLRPRKKKSGCKGKLTQKLLAATN